MPPAVSPSAPGRARCRRQIWRCTCTVKCRTGGDELLDGSIEGVARAVQLWRSTSPKLRRGEVGRQLGGADGSKQELELHGTCLLHQWRVSRPGQHIALECGAPPQGRRPLHERRRTLSSHWRRYRSCRAPACVAAFFPAPAPCLRVHETAFRGVTGAPRRRFARAQIWLRCTAYLQRNTT